MSTLVDSTTGVCPSGLETTGCSNALRRKLPLPNSISPDFGLCLLQIISQGALLVDLIFLMLPGRDSFLTVLMVPGHHVWPATLVSLEIPKFTSVVCVSDLGNCYFVFNTDHLAWNIWLATCISLTLRFWTRLGCSPGCSWNWLFRFLGIN